MELIRGFVRTAADEITQNAQDYGKLDVPNTLSYPVLVRLAEFYFGVPAPSLGKNEALAPGFILRFVPQFYQQCS